jgi:hypothetical protein
MRSELSALIIGLSLLLCLVIYTTAQQVEAKRLTTKTTTRRITTTRTTKTTTPKVCLNGGVLNPKTGLCTCTRCFSGAQCQYANSPCCKTTYCPSNRMPVVNNFFKQCECQCSPDFMGANCTIPTVCDRYCLNGGISQLSLNMTTCSCDCPYFYFGNKCETYNEVDCSYMTC